jgi:hypothetical protein
VLKQNPATQIYDSFKNTVPVIKAYETARSQGKGVVDSLSAANDQAGKQESANNAVVQAMDAYKKNPSHETAKFLTEAAGTVALLGAGGVEVDIPDAPEVTEAASTEIPEATEATSTQPGIISKLVKGEKVNQPQAQSALRQSAQASAQDAGVEATQDTSGIRTLMDQPIDSLAAKESAAYDTLNDAAETDLKSLYDHQSELQDALEDPNQIANKKALQSEFTQTQSQISDGEAKVTDKLGDNAPDMLSKAKAMTQQRYAMEDVTKKLFNNESVVKGNVAHDVPESINVDSAIRQVESLDKPSRFAPRGTPTRLQQAFGADGAKALKQGLYDAQKMGQSAVNARTMLKWGGGFLAGALGLGKLAHLGAALIP